ncbi:site-specific integrase [Mesorhizobium sp. B2-4-14]|uniref:site-specific integrase n=1 Tax=Mesorhizobium sp. B2-4-14 TaxID=2589935 RepID=UPI0015E446DA|nr:site-specific integrase [Mesorhizobium sp. B2-4-14]
MEKRTYKTDRELKALKPSNNWYDVKDEVTRNLIVRVGPETTKGEFRRTFCLVIRFPGSSNPVRHAFGEYKTDGRGDLTLEEARGLADEWRALIRKGTDPRKQIEDARREAERASAGKRDKAFETVLDRFIKARRRDGIRKADEDEKDFNRECLPVWRGKAVGDITSADIIEVLEKISNRGATRQALNMGQKIGTFLSWCVDDEVIDASPYRAKKVRTTIGEKTSRDRVFTDAELRALWKATEGTTEGVGDVYSSVYRLLLLTGQRLNDIAQASWSEINFDRKVLTIPAVRFKSERDHTVPLTDDAIAIIEKLPRFAKCPWLCSLDGKAAVTIGDKVKRRIDAAMLAVLKEEDPDLTLPAWVNHDLRRTVRTRLSELDVMDEVAEAVIGHVPTALVRTYNQSDRMKVKRDALTRWQGELNAIVGKGGADNVISLAATRGQ